MCAVTLHQLVNRLQQHHLLRPAHLEEATNELLARYGDPKTLLVELHRRKWLTAYQIRQLLEEQDPNLTLGQYLLLDLIGEGGMGRVYKAGHRTLNRTVALKVIRSDRLINPTIIPRFQREIRVLAQLSHPNIVFAYDADVADGTHFLVMEYVEGVNLKSMVCSLGPLPTTVACRYVEQALLGLQHVFEQKIVHRDLKPENLLVTSNSQQVKISDLGLSLLKTYSEDQRTSVQLTHNGVGTLLGTMDYLAPEQGLEPHSVDIRADLYSLGCTLHYLLVGRVPLPGGSTPLEKLLKICWEKPQRVEQLRADIPSQLGDIVQKMMAKHPEDRYQTPIEAAKALHPFSDLSETLQRANRSSNYPRTVSQVSPSDISPINNQDQRIVDEILSRTQTAGFIFLIVCFWIGIVVLTWLLVAEWLNA